MSQEIEPRKMSPIESVVRSRTADFGAVLPSHVAVDTFLSLAVSYVRRDKYLVQAAKDDPASLVLALRECAALGHLPMKGTYALVAFGGSVVGIEEVRGTIQRMYRSGGVQSVHVQLVRANDEFAWDPSMTVPHHRFDPLAGERVRGEIVGVYAFARFPGGGVSQVVVMGMDDIARYERTARTKKFWQGPWRPEMIQKTALHRLEKLVPTSSSYLNGLALSEVGSSQGFEGLPDTPAVGVYTDDEITDAEIVTETPGRTGPEQDWPAAAQPGG